MSLLRRSSNFFDGSTALLRLLDGPEPQVLRLEKSCLQIGRAPESDLVLAQPYVSRRHASLCCEAGEYRLVDAESRHGTFVNGRRVSAQILSNGDRLQFGSLHAPRYALSFEADTKSPVYPHPAQEAEEDSSDLAKLRWFVEATRELNSAGKLDQVLALLLSTTLRLAGMERGYIFLPGAGGSLQAALGMDAEGRLLESSDTLSRSVLEEAAEGTDQFLITDTLRASGGVVPASIVAHSIRSVLCIPLRTLRHKVSPEEKGAGRQTNLGVLYLDSRFEPGRVSALDHDLLRSIAREAAALVEIAQLAKVEEDARQQKSELAIAAAIQQGLMALGTVELPFASIEAHSAACSAVGGDFVAVLPGDQTVSVALVDVSGKGISAAILASTLQGMLQIQLEAGLPLAAIAATMNRYLCGKRLGKYATMLMLQLHADGRLQYINCGHVQPRICQGDRVGKLGVTNLPVGLLADAEYQAGTAHLLPGWRVLMVSDGFTEAEDAQGNFFGEERLDQSALYTCLASILDELRAFSAAHPASDDCTVVQVSFRGTV